MLRERGKPMVMRGGEKIMTGLANPWFSEMTEELARCPLIER